MTLPEVQVALPEVRKGSGGPPGDLGLGQEALPEVRKSLPEVRVALPEVRNGSEGPPSGMGWVGSLSRMSGTGREALPEV